MKNNKFVSQIGQLVTKTKIDLGYGNIEMLLLFHDKNDYPDHYQTLARLRDGKTEPFFGGYLSDSRKGVTITISGDVIVRSYASSENLRLIARMWNKKSYDREEWYAKIQKILTLSAEEVIRIDRAFGLGHTF